MILAIWLSIKLAALTTIILLVISIPLGWWLAKTKSPLKPVFDALVTLPLILPPTVLGYYLLVAFSPNNSIGRLWENLFNHTLAFSFSGLLVASIIYSLPFVVQPIRDGFRMLDDDLLDAAKCAGANSWQQFRDVIFPLTRQSLLTGIIMGFAHTVGEFGVVLLIGGNIPDETRVLSIALYEFIETSQIDKANSMALGMLVFSFIVLFSLSYLNQKRHS
jgi:molybdate transport system permease protein